MTGLILVEDFCNQLLSGFNYFASGTSVHRAISQTWKPRGEHLWQLLLQVVGAALRINGDLAPHLLHLSPLPASRVQHLSPPVCLIGPLPPAILSTPNFFKLPNPNLQSAIRDTEKKRLRLSCLFGLRQGLMAIAAFSLSLFCSLAHSRLATDDNYGLKSWRLRRSLATYAENIHYFIKGEVKPVV